MIPRGQRLVVRFFIVDRGAAIGIEVGFDPVPNRMFALDLENFGALILVIVGQILPAGIDLSVHREFLCCVAIKRSTCPLVPP